ncbi:MAG: D-aminoacylase [Acidobacteriota bacterium]
MERGLHFRNATIVDGSGSAAFAGDVEIEQDRITRVIRRPEAGPPEAPSAGTLPRPGLRVIDAAGKVLAPGFIDIHSHADLIFPQPEPRRSELLRGRIAQGITTEIIGNCGMGVAPLEPGSEEILRGINGWLTPETIPWPWRSLGDYLDRLEARGVPLNVGTLAPHGPLRIGAAGLAAGACAAHDLAAMREALRQALEDGAFGVSTGLIYPPGMYSDTDECAQMAEVAAKFDALYTSHIRGSSELLLPSVRELIEVGQRSGARVHHSHNEAVGRTHWKKVHEVLEIEDRARVQGVRLTHDMFPYPAAATTMLALFPPWSLEGGVETFLGRLREPGERRRIREAVERQTPEWPPWKPGGWPHNLSLAVGWNRIAIGSVASSERRELEGITLEELGRWAGRPPFEALCDLLLAEEGRVSQIVYDVTGDADHERGLEVILAHPCGALCTDANDYGRGKPHPAAYGAFPRVLGRYVRERRCISLEEAVRKMTSYPASLLGLRDRGTLREGAHADLVLFDPQRIADRATFDEPRQPPLGIDLVVINGRLALEGGRLAPSAAGRVLRRH